jgi:hypothetical protein
MMGEVLPVGLTHDDSLFNTGDGKGARHPRKLVICSLKHKRTLALLNTFVYYLFWILLAEFTCTKYTRKWRKLQNDVNLSKKV